MNTKDTQNDTTEQAAVYVKMIADQASKARKVASKQLMPMSYEYEREIDRLLLTASRNGDNVTMLRSVLFGIDKVLDQMQK